MRIAAGSILGVPLAALVDPIPADPPIGGPLWTLVVPAILLALSVAATFLLYRHFAGDGKR